MENEKINKLIDEVKTLLLKYNSKFKNCSIIKIRGTSQYLIKISDYGDKNYNIYEMTINDMIRFNINDTHKYLTYSTRLEK